VYDRYGNVDASCMVAYQHRWALAGATWTAGLALLAAATTAGSRRGRAKVAINVLAAVGAVALVGVVVANEAFAIRGGV
jgi:hypothetical protein